MFEQRRRALVDICRPDCLPVFSAAGWAGAALASSASAITAIKSYQSALIIGHVSSLRFNMRHQEKRSALRRTREHRQQQAAQPAPSPVSRSQPFATSECCSIARRNSRCACRFAETTGPTSADRSATASMMKRLCRQTGLPVAYPCSGNNRWASDMPRSRC